MQLFYVSEPLVPFPTLFSEETKFLMFFYTNHLTLSKFLLFKPTMAPYSLQYMRLRADQVTPKKRQDYCFSSSRKMYNTHTYIHFHLYTHVCMIYVWVCVYYFLENKPLTIYLQYHPCLSLWGCRISSVCPCLPLRWYWMS